MADDGTLRRQVERRLRREDRPDQLQWIAQARCLAATLDLLPQPIVLVVPGEPIRVWHANAAARRQFASSSILQMRGGVLVPADATCASVIGRAIQSALTLGPHHPQQLELSAHGDAATASLQVQMLDFGMNADLPVARMVLLELREKAGVEFGLQRLCLTFQLTPKEAEAAIGLYAIGSVGEFARSAGKSIHTVRTQLKAAMQKTGTHSQAGLVALVAKHLRD
jgi:DNA-binding CsgD family transcriptional regulator